MTQRTKTLGLALFALLAFGAMSATAASAQEKEFHSEFENTVLTGTDTEATFKTPNGTTTCPHNLFEGSQEKKTTKEVTITQTVPTNCTTEGRSTHVDFNGCDYDFTLEPGQTETEGGTKHTSGPVHIKCPEKQVIKLRVTEFGFTVCTIDIPPQTPTEPRVAYTNQGEGTTSDVRVVSTITGIMYEETGGFCPEAGTHHNASFHADITVKGFTTKEGAHNAHEHNNVQHGIWIYEK